jgi:large subunit ribosomal protein L22
MMEARAIQRTVRQSARKMRLVVDLIRGRPVPEADAILRFSKKGAALQIRKVLKSAIANAERSAERQNERLDVDTLRVKWAVVNEGPTLKRFTMAAMGRGTPIKKRTSHVEIRVGVDAVKPKAGPAQPATKAEGKAKAPATDAKTKKAAAASTKAANPGAKSRGKGK